MPNARLRNSPRSEALWFLLGFLLEILELAARELALLDQLVEGWALVILGIAVHVADLGERFLDLRDIADVFALVEQFVELGAVSVAVLAVLALVAHQALVL